MGTTNGFSKPQLPLCQFQSQELATGPAACRCNVGITGWGFPQDPVGRSQEQTRGRSFPHSARPLLRCGLMPLITDMLGSHHGHAVRLCPSGSFKHNGLNVFQAFIHVTGFLHQNQFQLFHIQLNETSVFKAYLSLASVAQ